ncbi:MAG: 30S ribosomal protein S6 [Bacteroidota bacterium]|nr:30S ribosomal protein S6 [Bacteroidota bacterium]
MKRFYECTFIVNPGLDDGQIENTVKMAEDTIVKNGGEIVNIEQIGRRRLAYPISKKHNGFYISMEFEAEGRIIEKVERFLTLDENVMRYLTVSLDARELESKRNRTALVLQERSRDGKSGGDAKPADKPEAKPAEKAEEKTEAKAEAKTEEKTEEKAEEKTEAKAEAKAEEKTEEKAEEKAEETDGEEASTDK